VSEISLSIPFGNHTLTLSTGKIANQATGSVVVNMDDTVVLVTVVGNADAPPSQSGLPLRVDYQERSYAVGKIPGGFFKREGRPSEREVLICRLIDRPLRPLFPEGFAQEMQIVATVISLNPEVDSDIPAMIGASAALALSGIPFAGPMGAARVGYIDGQYILNPTQTELKDSVLDLVVAGDARSVHMVESEAKELSEDIMLGAVMFGHRGFQAVIRMIDELKEKAGKPDWDWEASAHDEEVCLRIRNACVEDIEAAYLISKKAERQARLRSIRKAMIKRFANTEEEDSFDEKQVSHVVSELESSVVRTRILQGKPRIDGRDNKTVRPIKIELGLLPRTHGSALFSRGETQAMAVATLGTTRDSQIIDSPLGEYKDAFMLHYNFPPYSVGEVGMVGSPKRREVGHGRLAKRAIAAVLPTSADFPYVLRVVSEITTCNGSSSMATVCGASLALMDAGVPIKSAVAGIAMGLIKDGPNHKVLTDILGDEDHLGDMDFKVAGTRQGITALQMDIKIDGISEEIMASALAQAKDGRLHILTHMEAAIAAPREELSDFAPQIITFRINPEKIRDVIGKGGATIRALTEETGAVIEIQDDGTVLVAATDRLMGEEARRRIEQLTCDLEVGQIYEGKVVRLAEFGAFVNVLPGKDGLVHISQITHRRVENVNDELEEGQMVRVQVLEIDRQGRVRLSMKSLIEATYDVANDA